MLYLSLALVVISQSGRVKGSLPKVSCLQCHTAHVSATCIYTLYMQQCIEVLLYLLQQCSNNGGFTAVYAVMFTCIAP